MRRKTEGSPLSSIDPPAMACFASNSPLRIFDISSAVRYYLPKDDVRMDLLQPTSFHTTCPFKGEASYWSAEVGGTRHDGIVWAYEEPIAGAEAIAGHLSFYPDRVEVTVDGETLERR